MSGCSHPQYHHHYCICEAAPATAPEHVLDHPLSDLISVTLLFQFISVMNLAAISLERLHATFRPIQHRLLSNWHYGVIIFVMWFISVVLSSIPVVLHQLFTRSLKLLTYYYYIYFSIDIFFILVIFASYISILAKVRCSPRPRHDGGSNREQRLTITLLMMTLASLLTWLPELVFFFIKSTPYFKDYIKISVHSTTRTENQTESQDIQLNLRMP